MKCDDDKMSNTTTEEILKLSGGGKFSKLSQRHISSQCPNNDYEDDKKMVGQSFKSKKDAIDRTAEQMIRVVVLGLLDLKAHYFK